MIISVCENSHLTIVLGTRKVILDFRNQNTPSIHYFKDIKGNSISLTGEKLDEEPTYKKTKNHVCICKSKISGSNNPMYGKHHTEESKRKMREGKKKQWKAQRGSR